MPGPEIPLKQATRHVVADEVYETLRNALLSGGIPADTWLNLEQLARQVGVSVTPIRQALTRLAADGLVTNVPYRGFVTSPLLDRAGIRDLYEARLLLETATAEKAARRVQADQLGELDRLLDAQAGQHSGDEDFEVEATRLDSAFHAHLATIAGNAVIADELRRLHSISARFQSMFARPRAVELAHAEHSAIAQAIRRGDPAAAADAMRAHLVAAQHRMESAFE